jgi:hypothetical protein
VGAVHAAPQAFHGAERMIRLPTITPLGWPRGRPCSPLGATLRSLSGTAGPPALPDPPGAWCSHPPLSVTLGRDAARHAVDLRGAWVNRHRPAGAHSLALALGGWFSPRRLGTRRLPGDAGGTRTVAASPLAWLRPAPDDPARVSLAFTECCS